MKQILEFHFANSHREKLQFSPLWSHLLKILKACLPIEKYHGLETCARTVTSSLKCAEKYQLLFYSLLQYCSKASYHRHATRIALRATGIVSPTTGIV